MSKFEDPIQFDGLKRIGNIEIMYSDLIEVSQGGPLIGNISINGKMTQGRYGGPCICKDNYVYAPIYVRRFLGTGFKLARINVITLETELLSKTKILIFIDKIEDNNIYYFEDLKKQIRSYSNI